MYTQVLQVAQDEYCRYSEAASTREHYSEANTTHSALVSLREAK